MSPHVRQVKTASGATAVQVVVSRKRGHRVVEHMGSAHDPVTLALLRAAGEQRVEALRLQDQLPWEPSTPAPPTRGAVPITSCRLGVLWDTLNQVWALLGLDQASGHDRVFRKVALARVIEATSKLDAIRVLGDVGVPSFSYATLKRRLPGWASPGFGDALSGACAARAALGPAALVLYDVTTLATASDKEDDFRKVGYSKIRSVDPQVTVGLLTDQTGFPLMVEAFEGNKAEKTTMIPVVERFVRAHGIAGVTVVADAGMMSAANMDKVVDLGWTFIVGSRLADVPAPVRAWDQAHPDEAPPNGLVLHQPDPDHQGWTLVYQYRAKRAARGLRGIDAQVARAEQAVAGKTPIKRNRFVVVSRADARVNRELEAKARQLAGWRSYLTNLDAEPGWVIDRYHDLWRIEHAFRISKHDLDANPVYHRLETSIKAHLNVVFAGLAVARHIEAATGWSIDRFVKTMRHYKTITLDVAGHAVAAQDPIPDDIRAILTLATQPKPPEKGTK